MYNATKTIWQIEYMFTASFECLTLFTAQIQPFVLSLSLCVSAFTGSAIVNHSNSFDGPKTES